MIWHVSRSQRNVTAQLTDIHDCIYWKGWTLFFFGGQERKCGILWTLSVCVAFIFGNSRRMCVFMWCQCYLLWEFYKWPHVSLRYLSHIYATYRIWRQRFSGMVQGGLFTRRSGRTVLVLLGYLAGKWDSEGKEQNNNNRKGRRWFWSCSRRISCLWGAPILKGTKRKWLQWKSALVVVCHFDDHFVWFSSKTKRGDKGLLCSWPCDVNLETFPRHCDSLTCAKTERWTKL